MHMVWYVWHDGLVSLDGWFRYCEKTVGEAIANGKMSTCFYYDDMFANIYRSCDIRL